jgi:hypothetical protein
VAFAVIHYAPAVQFTANTRFDFDRSIYRPLAAVKVNKATDFTANPYNLWPKVNFSVYEWCLAVLRCTVFDNQQRPNARLNLPH